MWFRAVITFSALPWHVPAKFFCSCSVLSLSLSLSLSLTHTHTHTHTRVYLCVFMISLRVRLLEQVLSNGCMISCFLPPLPVVALFLQTPGAEGVSFVEEGSRRRGDGI